jgi:hypothetical protein
VTAMTEDLELGYGDTSGTGCGPALRTSIGDVAAHPSDGKLEMARARKECESGRAWEILNWHESRKLLDDNTNQENSCLGRQSARCNSARRQNAVASCCTARKKSRGHVTPFHQPSPTAFADMPILAVHHNAFPIMHILHEVYIYMQQIS